MMQTEQLTLFETKELEPRPDKPLAISSTNSVEEKKLAARMRYFSRNKSLGGKGHVKEYYKKSCKTWYYCFSYRAGNKVKNIHIPGGNVWSNLATKRAHQVQRAIDSGEHTLKIIELIDCFSRK